jgi:hypothetical protein
MPQARILEPENTPHAPTLKNLKFRWCKKDHQWERNGNNPTAIIEEVNRTLPGLRTEIMDKAEPDRTAEKYDRIVVKLPRDTPHAPTLKNLNFYHSLPQGGWSRTMDDGVDPARILETVKYFVPAQSVELRKGNGL